MKAKLRFLLSFLSVLLLICFWGYPSRPFISGALGQNSLAASNVQVQVDGRLLTFDQPPIIFNDRVLVPVRKICEALNAQVTWEPQTSTARIVHKSRVVVLQVDSTQAWINGRAYTIDVSALVVNDRTLVPLRFLNEALGFTVDWDPANRRAIILSDQAQNKPSTSGTGWTRPFSSEQSIFGVKIGDQGEMVIALLGQPQRIDPGEYGHESWVYNQEPERLVMVGVGNNRVKAIFTSAKDVTVGGVAMDDSSDSLASRVNIQSRVAATYAGAKFEFSLSESEMNEKPLVITNDIASIYYLDTHRNGRVSGILLLDLETLVQSRRYNYRFMYYGEPPNVKPAILSSTQRMAVASAYEKQMLDLANATRKKLNVPVLTDDPEAANVIRNHCLDMATNRFFSHDSPTTGSFSDRIRRSGISFSLAAENIAMGQADPIETHFGWLNSLGHRHNLLEPRLKGVGGGVAFGDDQGEIVRYYGQNFVTRR